MRRSSHLAFVYFVAICATAMIVSPALAQMRGDFDAADVDHDGKVTLQEFETYATHTLMSKNGFMAQRFKAMNPDEQKSRMGKRFDKADTDHNGYLDRKEWRGS